MIAADLARAARCLPASGGFHPFNQLRQSDAALVPAAATIERAAL
jgi:hypothetical protein